MSKLSEKKVSINKDLTQLNELGSRKLQNDEFDYQLEILQTSLSTDNRILALKSLCQMFHSEESFLLMNETTMHLLVRALRNELQPQTIVHFLVFFLILLNRSAYEPQKAKRKTSKNRCNILLHKEIMMTNDLWDAVFHCIERLYTTKDCGRQMVEAHNNSTTTSQHTSATSSPIKASPGIRSKRKFAGNQNGITALKRALSNNAYCDKKSNPNSTNTTPTSTCKALSTFCSPSSSKVSDPKKTLSLLDLKPLFPQDIWDDLDLQFTSSSEITDLPMSSAEVKPILAMSFEEMIIFLQGQVIHKGYHLLITEINQLNTTILFQSTDNCGMQSTEQNEDDENENENEDEDEKVKGNDSLDMKSKIEMNMRKLTIRKKLLQSIQSAMHIPLLQTNKLADKLSSSPTLLTKTNEEVERIPCNFLENLVQQIAHLWPIWTTALSHILLANNKTNDQSNSSMKSSVGIIEDDDDLWIHDRDDNQDKNDNSKTMVEMIWYSNQLLLAFNLLEASGFYCLENQVICCLFCCCVCCVMIKCIYR